MGGGWRERGPGRTIHPQPSDTALYTGDATALLSTPGLRNGLQQEQHRGEHHGGRGTHKAYLQAMSSSLSFSSLRNLCPATFYSPGALEGFPAKIVPRDRHAAKAAELQPLLS